MFWGKPVAEYISLRCCEIRRNGFAKNERDNISNNELLTLREIASGVLNASEENLAQALKDGTLIEVEHDEDSEKGKSKNKSPDK